MALKDMLKTSDKDSSELLVSLDIGTEVVKALIAEVKDDELKIIGVGRKQQEMGDMHSGAIADIEMCIRDRYGSGQGLRYRWICSQTSARIRLSDRLDEWGWALNGFFPWTKKIAWTALAERSGDFGGYC